MSVFLDQLRYWVAVLTVVTLPGAITYWYVVHPFAGFWRRFGVRPALAVMFTLFGLSMLGLFLVRDRLVGADQGPPHPAQVAVGALLVLSAMVGGSWVGRHLTRRVLVGVPELSPEDSGKLLTAGPYAYCRNPRYLVILVAMAGYSFLLNYVGVWIATVLCFPSIFLIILLEERELEERFGKEYREYCRSVPRLLPLSPRHAG